MVAPGAYRSIGMAIGIAVGIIEAVMCFLEDIYELPMEPLVIHFLPIFLGVTVQASYCIWKGAYIGLNTQLSRYTLIMTLVSLVNFGSAFLAYRTGTLFEGLKLQAPFVNLLCGVMFAVIGVVSLIRKAAESREDE